MHRSNCTYLLATLSLGLATAPAFGQCSPTLVSTFTNTGTNGIAIDGTVAFVNGANAMTAWDLSDPTNPTVLGSAANVGQYSWGLAHSNGLVLVTNERLGPPHLYDVSNPSAPVLIADLPTPTSNWGCDLSGTTAYVYSGNVLHTVDISTPAAPVPLGSLATGTGSNRGFDIRVVGTLAYVAHEGDGLVIVDVTNPATPSMVGSFVTPSAGSLEVAGSLAYVASFDGTLNIIDVSSPATPVLLGSVATSSGSYPGITLSGPRAYMVSGDRISAVDISDSSNPNLLGSTATTGDRNIAAFGDYAIHTGGGTSLQVFDMSSCSTGDLTLETVDCPDDTDAVEAGYQIEVELWMRNLPTAASGFQAFLTYDDAVFSYRGDLSSYSATPFPLHFQDLTTAEIAAGELRLDGLDMLGGPGETTDSLLATLVFDVDAECSTTIPVSFDLAQPFASELSFDGDPLDTDLTDAPSISVDDTPPTLDPCPANITQAADADNGDGCQGAIVSFTDPGATDNCGGTPTVVCDPASGSFFSVGTTTVTCTATDDCGNESQCTFDVTVTATNLVDVDVELFGLNSPAMRCVYFVLDDCGVSVDVTLDFIDHDGDDTNENGIVDSTEGTTDDPSTPVRAVDTIEVPCGNWTSICAKDEQHTKWFNADLVVNGATYGLDAGTPLLSLRAGDTDNDGDVDINDATLLIAQFGSAEPAGGCPWNGMRGADFSNDGNVGSEDYSLLSAQWLTLSGCSCTGSTTWTGGTSVATATLEPWIAKRADLNRDGFVDRTDVRIFEAIHGLNGSLSEAMKMSDRLGGR